MADHIEHSTHIKPIEELTDEQGNTVKILSGEVGTSLGGSGESVDLVNFTGGGVAANQGYLNGAVNYLDAIHTSEGVKLSTNEPAIFTWIKNTGFKFSSTTVLGAATTDCIMVVKKTLAWVSSTQAGWQNSADAAQIHYFMIGWLKPGEGMYLPAGIETSSNKFDLVSGNANELSYLNDDSTTRGDSQIYCKTFTSSAAAATDGNAVEHLTSIFVFA